jgi:hypothetical protein
MGTGYTAPGTAEAAAPDAGPRRGDSYEPLLTSPYSAGMLLRYLWIIVLCALVLGAVGVAVGVARKPVYTSTAQLSVGRLDVTAQALPGFAQASRDLSQVYSRLAMSDRVVGETASRTGISSADVRSRLSAAAVTQSPIFRLNATGSSAEDAERLARAATTATERYVRELDSTPRNQAELLNQYRTVAAQVARLETRVGRLGTLLSRSPRARLVRARFNDMRLEIQKQRLRKDALAAAYQDLIQRTNQAAGLSVLSQPSTASSDRTSYAQKLGLAGLAVGLLVGVSLALALARRRWRMGSLVPAG